MVVVAPINPKTRLRNMVFTYKRRYLKSGMPNSIWDHSWIQSGEQSGEQSRKQSRTNLGPIRDPDWRSGFNLGSIWDQSGTQIGNLGSMWDQSGINLGPIRDRPQIEKSIWDQSGINPGFNPGGGVPDLSNLLHKIVKGCMTRYFKMVPFKKLPPWNDAY